MTTADDAPNPAPVTSTKPRRVFFPEEDTTTEATTPAPPAPAPATATADSPAPAAAALGSPEAARRPRTPRPAPAASAVPVPTTGEQGAVGKKRGPKPSAEPMEHSTFKVKSAHLQNLDNMLEDAPRHVLKQDLMDFILTDFFERYKKLPDALRKRKPSNK